MLAELERALRTGLTGEQLYTQVLQDNLLVKTTVSGRAITYQRLRELYGLDETIPLFRVLTLLWQRDNASLPLLGILAALARDPLLRATALPILGLPVGSELARDAVRDAVVGAVGIRLNDATVEKAVRNAASSWAQSGHLKGRTFKRRTQVQATPASLAFAIWLANAAGFKGETVLSSGWITVLDLEGTELRRLLDSARIAGLIVVRQIGSCVELDASRLTEMRYAA